MLLCEIAGFKPVKKVKIKKKDKAKKKPRKSHDDVRSDSMAALNTVLRGVTNQNS